MTSSHAVTDAATMAGADDALFSLADAWQADGHRLVFAIVIRTWGSSPRQIGSLMLVRDARHFKLRAHAAGTDAVTRTKFTAAWFPTPLLMHVCDLTAQDTALDGLRLELEAELDKHRRRSEADTAKLAGFAR